ncbi:MAG: hypothetical protein ACREJC_14605 [Tepidisphaeraceae bacterium]
MRRLLPILLSVTVCSACLACPMCKDSVPNSDAQQAGGLPGGFNSSVYTLLIGFLTVLGLVSGLIIKGVRDATARTGFPVQPADQNPTSTETPDRQ